MVDWAVEFVPPKNCPSVLEVGCGNGTLLFALIATGYSPNTLSGIDYSQGAIELARSIAPTRGGKQITFTVGDFFNLNPLTLSHGLPGQQYDMWDLLLDKGTFDAIALGEKNEDGKSPAVAYPKQVAKLLKDTGFFLITCMSHQYLF